MPDNRTCMDEGFCKEHGVEIERRNNDRRLIDKVPPLLSWMNFFKGFTMFTALAITAAFIFTRDVDANAQERDRVTNVKLDILTAQVSTLATAAAVSAKEDEALRRSINRLSQDIRALINHQSKMHGNTPPTLHKYEGAKTE